MRRSEEVRRLSIKLDLSCTGEPIAECHRRPGRMSEVPTVDEAVDRTGGENVRMMGREVDVGDCPRMRV